MNKSELMRAIWLETERRAAEWSKRHNGNRMSSSMWNTLWEKVKSEIVGNRLTIEC